MAESLWLTLLFPSNVGAAKKRENVLEIWSWSGEDLNATHPLLADGVLGGIGSAGTAYNTHRWRELVFLIGALRDFKARDGSEREQIGSDPWAFSGWLSGLPEARHRQLIHILPHLLFPDTFERISSERDKRLILAGFGDTPEKEIKKWSTVEIDRALLNLRRRLEKEHCADIDFYQEEFESQWKNQTKNWLLSWNPSRWTWDTLAADRAATISGEKADNRWRCSSSKPREGDRVFLIRTGIPPKGVVAVGKITRAPYEAEHWEQARADAGETTRFVDVAFDSVRDATTDEIVPLEELQSREPDQEWNPQSSGIEIKAKAARSLERLWKALPQIGPDGTTQEDDAGSGDASPKKLAPPLNLILYGPPGTGKTYRLKNDYLPRYRDEAGDRFEFVTFHQSYAYEDFVEGIRPVTENGVVTYEVRPGVLKRLCDRARRAPDKRFALFIDEINRGNVAKIFGELITLLEVDKRIRIDASGNRLASCKGLEVTLPYSGERFGVPANVDVIGTMNTADRSIALLDSALRRRFRFEELTPKPELLGPIDDGEGNPIDLRELLRVMNDRLSRLLHRDQTLGHSYFYHVKSFDELRRVFAREILPFLQEAFYDDWRQIRYVLADQAVEEELQLVRALTQSAAVLFPKADPTEIGDGEAFEIIREDDITPDAIRKIYEPPE
ncbi:5-methylcytosine-specific restriction enzyme B [Oceanicella actignis]|uniref:5-methylcytosine-specific restriction enzyme B n=2 Tax=Oceanicella actignis TaxID=1189325 RepID=A0A1M7U535_9RHOB|nr:5-methylcytosine-specific restriction enzyme B [Oceanicella actignis]SHN78119.1 5-methylcytosine-specific restriction enzyme B [Oceanicella actignis]